MASTLYTLRRKRRQCTVCGHPSPQHTRCDACRLAYNTAKRERYAWRQAHAGPNVVYCCGASHAITQVPQRLACCGRVLGAVEDAR